MKTLVCYYSKTGNNKFLAEKIAENLAGDVEEIKPKSGAFPIHLMATWFQMGCRLKVLNHKVEDYDQVVFCGPIWMGQLIAPLRGFIKKYRDRVNSMVFASCCGSTDETRGDKFGYEKVFEKAKNLARGKLKVCEVFSIMLIVPKDKQKDSDYMMKVRLSEENFKGKIEDRVNGFVDRVKNL